MDLSKLKQLAGIAPRDHTGVNVVNPTPEQRVVSEMAELRAIAGLPALTEGYNADSESSSQYYADIKAGKVQKPKDKYEEDYMLQTYHDNFKKKKREERKKVTEWADDEDLSPAERELARMAERDLKRKGIKVDADPDKDLEKLAKSKAAKKAAAKEEIDSDSEAKEEAAKKAAEKQAAAKEAADREKAVASEKDDDEKPAVKPVEKKEEPAAPTAEKASSVMRAWMSAHPTADRKAFFAFTRGKNIGNGNASAFWQKNRPRSEVKAANEWYVLTHPQMPALQLAENKQMGMYEWADLYSNLEPMVFVNREDAEKTAKHLKDWKSKVVNITTVSLKDFN